jgi:hypothetical protein
MAFRHTVRVLRMECRTRERGHVNAGRRAIADAQLGWGRRAAAVPAGGGGTHPAGIRLGGER